MTVNRTRRDSARAPDDSLFLCRQLSGDLGLEQQGRAIVLGPGEMTLLDAQRVYRGDFRAGSRLMVLKMPRRAMEARCGDLTALLAQKARPHAGVRSVISGHVAMLEQGTETMDLPAQTVVREYTLDLIALSLAATASHSAARSLAFSQPSSLDEARLADPGLDPLRPHVAPVLGSSMHTRCFRNRAPRSRGGSTSDGWTAAALLSPTPHTDTVPSATLPSDGFLRPHALWAPCSKGVSACVRANIATRGNSGGTRSNKPSRAAPRLVVLGFDGYIAGMDLLGRQFRALDDFGALGTRRACDSVCACDTVLRRHPGGHSDRPARKSCSRKRSDSGCRLEGGPASARRSFDRRTTPSLFRPIRIRGKWGLHQPPFRLLGCLPKRCNPEPSRVLAAILACARTIRVTLRRLLPHRKLA